MDHRSFIRTLTSEQRKALTVKSNGKGLAQLAIHLGAILIVTMLIVYRIPFWPALLVLQGILLIFLFCLMHESVHRTPFRTRWINDAVATSCGLVLVLPPEWFRQFHFAHHRYTQDPDKDPELASSKPNTFGEYLIYLSGFPVWKSQLSALVNNALSPCQDSFVPVAKQQLIRAEAIGMLLLYSLLLGVSWHWQTANLLYLWLIPLILGQPFLRLYLLAEHSHCKNVTDMFENTRTTMTHHLIYRLSWNMPYHAEHHAYPQVPFHRLADFHTLAKPHLKVLTPGYRKFHRDYLDT
ncbi:MAG: fatty acid desaturase [Gammaproteobacteria bacterium]|nr:fatty acid desaturase [Gammaproteobacteria bacterium]